MKYLISTQRKTKNAIQQSQKKRGTYQAQNKTNQKIESDENIREIIYHNYRLVYKLSSEKIYITIISHGSYDLSDKLDSL